MTDYFNYEVIPIIVTVLSLIPITYYISKRYNIRYIIFINYIYFGGIILLGRDFSYLNIKIGSFPLYITEFVLIIDMIYILLQGMQGMQGKGAPHKRGKKREVRGWNINKISFVIYLFVIYSGIVLLWSFFTNTGTEVILLLRRYALYYYSLFFIVFLNLFNNEKDIERLFKIVFVLIISRLFMALLGLANPDIGSVYGGPFGCIYAGMVLFYFICEYKYINRFKAVWFLLVSIIVFSTIHSPTRGAWIAYLFSFTILYFISDNNTKKIMNRFILAFSIGFVFMYTAFTDFTQSVINEFLSIFINVGDSISINNRIWRLTIWKEIIMQVINSCMMGVGFAYNLVVTVAIEEAGSQFFIFKNVDPHNSTIHIFFRTGLIGVGIFFTIIAAYFKKLITFYRNSNNDYIKNFIIMSIIVMINILSISSFNVVLEGPYMGISLWAFMAVSYNYIKIRGGTY